MSTIKVNKIENTSTTNGGIEVDTSGHVTVDGQQMPTDGALSNRNLIYNGAMQVAQRSTAEVNGATSGGGLAYTTLDRWGHWGSGANLFSSDQVEDAPPGFYHSVKLKSLASTNMSAGGYITWSQRLEAQDLYRTGIGTANAKDLTLSFWVKGSTTGTYSFYAFNANWSYCFVSTYTVNTANTWEYKTISIPGPTSNFTATGNSRQLEIGFTLGAGTNYQTSTLNQWQSASYMIGATNTVNLVSTANATLNLTGIQLEVGEKATPFEHRSYGDELARCRRYYFQSKQHGGTYEGCYYAYGISTNRIGAQLRLPVEMRTEPSFVLVRPVDGVQDGAHRYYGVGSGATGDVSFTSVGFADRGRLGFPYITLNNNSIVQGAGYLFHIEAHAEL